MAHVLGIGRRLDVAAEPDRIVDLGALEFPRIAVAQPILGNFLLPAVADDLPEQAVIIPNAVAVRCDRKRRHAVHEAGGEASEAAIAERGVGFDAPQRIEIDAELAQRLGHRLDDAEIGHRIDQQAADQELEREIINPLLVLVVDAVGRGDPVLDHDIARRVRDRHEPVALARRHWVLRDYVLELVEHRLLELFGGIGAHARRGSDGVRCRVQLIHTVAPLSSTVASGRPSPIFVFL